MKILELDQVGITELNVYESDDINGGFLPIAVMVVCWAVTASAAAITVSLGAGYYNNR